MVKSTRIKKINRSVGNKHIVILGLILLFFVTGKAQSFSDFLTPSDSLNTTRRAIVVTSQAAVSTVALIGLHEMWYKDYPKSSFHFKNDNADWLQMDKAGHVFSSYHLGRISSDLLQWSGVSHKQSVLYGGGFGLAFLTAVEVFDGTSSEWGFSWGDVAANATGTFLYISQEYLWREQRVIPKYSFHTTHLAKMRPEVLGTSLNEQLLKDYNGQTYWLSANLYSFLKWESLPKWFNVAAGYGAHGMLAGNAKTQEGLLLPSMERYRQFYLSFDVDLSKIETKSRFLRTLFSTINVVKIPAPTVEFAVGRKPQWYLLYF